MMLYRLQNHPLRTLISIAADHPSVVDRASQWGAAVIYNDLIEAIVRSDKDIWLHDIKYFLDRCPPPVTILVRPYVTSRGNLRVIWSAEGSDHARRISRFSASDYRSNELFMIHSIDFLRINSWLNFDNEKELKSIIFDNEEYDDTHHLKQQMIEAVCATFDLTIKTKLRRFLAPLGAEVKLVSDLEIIYDRDDPDHRIRRWGLFRPDERAAQEIENAAQEDVRVRNEDDALLDLDLSALVMMEAFTTAKNVSTFLTSKAGKMIEPHQVSGLRRAFERRRAQIQSEIAEARRAEREVELKRRMDTRAKKAEDRKRQTEARKQGIIMDKPQRKIELPLATDVDIFRRLELPMERILSVVGPLDKIFTKPRMDSIAQNIRLESGVEVSRGDIYLNIVPALRRWRNANSSSSCCSGPAERP